MVGTRSWFRGLGRFRSFLVPGVDNEKAKERSGRPSSFGRGCLASKIQVSRVGRDGRAVDYMPRVKITMLSLLAVLALSAAASATASAATHQWIINGTALGKTETTEFQGNGLPYVQEGQFESAVAGTSLHIYCQTAILPSGPKNVLVGGEVGKAEVSIEFSGCALFTISKAGVSETLSTCKIETEPIIATAEGEMKEAGILTLKEKGVPFSKFNIVKVGTSTCGAEIKLEIKGTQVCVLPHFGVALYVHVLECTPGGSSLTTSLAEPARLYLGTGITLEKGGKFWSS